MHMAGRALNASSSKFPAYTNFGCIDQTDAALFTYSILPRMITKFMTEITAKFNPFSACAKPARLFLTLVPPDARANGTIINTTVLARTSTEPSSVSVKFSKLNIH